VLLFASAVLLFLIAFGLLGGENSKTNKCVLLFFATTQQLQTRNIKDAIKHHTTELATPPPPPCSMWPTSEI
jgi:hypothetical protein